MEKWQLNEIAGLFGARLAADAEITEICTDSRAIAPGCLFIALEGERFDGHDFVADAFAKGAAAAVCRKRVTQGEEPVIYVKDTLRALITIGCAYRLKYELPVVAITGSVGKTTTKDMVACAIGSQRKTLKTEGNRNNEIGLPLTLLNLDKSYEAAVIEMGMTHFGDLSLLTAATLPCMAIITNIGVSHIENLGSRENIFKAKLEIAEGLPQGGTLVLNYDDDLLCTVKRLWSLHILSYGIDSTEAAVRAQNILEADGETAFDICYQGETYPVRIPCVGRHNVYNALSAFCASVVLGLDLYKSVAALSGYSPSGMRQHLVQKGGMTVIEDCYNASPDSMKAALSTLRSVKGEGRAIAVLADMLELGSYSQKAHEDVGRMVGESHTDVLIAWGVEAVHIAQAARQAGVKEVHYFTEKQSAAQKLCELAQEGDTILFKGSRGMRLEEMIERLYKSLEQTARQLG